MPQASTPINSLAHTNIDFPDISAIRKRISLFSGTRKKTDAMIKEAVIAMGEDGKGVSVPVMVKWIMANYGIVDMNRLKNCIKKAIVKCLESGTLVRARSSLKALGCTGSFALPDTKSKNASSRVKAPKTTKMSSNSGTSKKVSPKRSKAVEHRSKLPIRAEVPRTHGIKNYFTSTPNVAQVAGMKRKRKNEFIGRNLPFSKNMRFL